MTVGELFCGIGGIGLGLERAGMEVKWAIDNDPYACAVYRKNFPHVRMIEQDITTVDFTELERVDLITGGFPCQDISYAGKGAGIEGPKSGLWSEFWRAIRDMEPEIILVENVPAILVRGADKVCGDLAEIGLYGEWDCIPSGYFGTHFCGDRFFLIASRAAANSSRREGVWPPERGPWSHEQLERLLRLETQHAIPASSLGRVSDGISNRMDRLRCLGNAVVPQVAEWIGRRIMEVYGHAEREE